MQIYLGNVQFLLKARDLQIKMKSIFWRLFSFLIILYTVFSFLVNESLCLHFSSQPFRELLKSAHTCQPASPAIINPVWICAKLPLQLPQVQFERVASGSHRNQLRSQGDDFQLPYFVELFKWIFRRSLRGVYPLLSLFESKFRWRQTVIPTSSLHPSFLPIMSFFLTSFASLYLLSISLILIPFFFPFILFYFSFPYHLCSCSSVLFIL